MWVIEHTRVFSHLKTRNITSENAQVVLNIVKYRKPINADNVYFIIRQNNEVKGKKDVITQKIQ